MIEERILKLLDTEQLSSSKFADIIGVQRSSVSHILTGRNKPSFDFVQKTLKAFPLLDADWLILGKGEMYSAERGAGGGSLFDQNKESTGQTRVSSAGSEEGSVQSRDRLYSADLNISTSASPSEQTNRSGELKSEQNIDNVDNNNLNESLENIEQNTKESQRTIASGQSINQANELMRSAEISSPENDVTVNKENNTGSLSGEKSASEKRVTRVILFYSDNSFDIYGNA